MPLPPEDLMAAANISITHPQTAELLEAALKPFRK